MRPFDLTKAKLGQTLITRDGKLKGKLLAEINAWPYPLIVLFTKEGGEEFTDCFTEDGMWAMSIETSDRDLFVVDSPSSGTISQPSNSTGYITTESECDYFTEMQKEFLSDRQSVAKKKMIDSTIEYLKSISA